MPSASHGNKHQHDHHRNGDEAAADAAAAVSATAAAIVVASATAAGRAAEVAVEGRHVLGIARVTGTVRRIPAGNDKAAIA